MKDKINESLHKLVHRYRHSVRDAISQTGITIPVGYIRSLKCLKGIENCTAKDISKRLGLDKSQVTRMLKDLVEQGYITKERDPNNHRCQILTMTDRGDALMNDIIACEKKASRNMTEGLTEQQLESFIHIADVMRENLSKPTVQGNKQ